MIVGCTFSALFILMIMTWVGILAHGEELVTSDLQTSFSIRNILPENLESEDSTFFDLRMEPDQEQFIEVEIRNNTNETIHIEVSLYIAVTNQEGRVEYQRVSHELSSISLHNLEDIITVDSLIEVEPYGVASVHPHIRMPKEGYNGVLAGALKFTRIKNEETVVGEGSIINTYSFMTGIMLHQGTLREPEIIFGNTDFSFEEKEVVIVTNFQNIKKAFVGEMEIEMEIKNLETNQLVFENRQKNMSMAPVSHFNYAVPIDRDVFTGSNYLVKYRIKSRGITWEFQENILLFETSLDIDEEMESAGDQLQGFLGFIFFVGISMGVGGILWRKKVNKRVKKSLSLQNERLGKKF